MWKSIYRYSLIAAFLVSTVASPAWALDWRDPEWTDLGCPSRLSGDWFPSTHSPYAGLKIEFKTNGAALSSKKYSDMFFAFYPNRKGEQFLNLKRVSEDPASFPRYLKIRPHIAVQSISEGKRYTLCKIKVFLFESKQKADQMSYLSWDIYSTIDSNEVRNGN